MTVTYFGHAGCGQVSAASRSAALRRPVDKAVADAGAGVLPGGLGANRRRGSNLNGASHRLAFPAFGRRQRRDGRGKRVRPRPRWARFGPGRRLPYSCSPRRSGLRPFRRARGPGPRYRAGWRVVFGGRCEGAASPGTSAGAASGRASCSWCSTMPAAVPAGRLRRRRRLLRPLRLPDHRAAALLRPSATGRVSARATSTSGAPRRILPAAALTLVVHRPRCRSTCSTLVRAREAVTDSVWAALFGANVHFAARGKRLLQPGPAALAAAQHFWTLSVEEQFYPRVAVRPCPRGLLATVPPATAALC